MRSCEVCNSNLKNEHHHQSFVSPGIEAELYYKVVSCGNCGFTYADDVPCQKVLNLYYESVDHHIHSKELPRGLMDIHADFFEFIKNNIPELKSTRVLDVGSSMGHFLKHFKDNGVNDILGLEVSLTAKILAKEQYDISVIPENLECYKPGNKFNLITLCGVLEHIEALKPAIDKINNLLEFNGHLFVAVPDVENFPSTELKEPFLEFALEHINFFSKTSLENIFISHGFELVTCKDEYYDFYNNHYILAIFKKIGSKSEGQTLSIDSGSISSIKSYVSNSNGLLALINKKINLLYLSQERLIVWGAGSLSARLCATTSIRETNLIGFVDRNEQIQGKSIFGKLIHHPDWIQGNRDCTILVVSSVYASSIKLELLNEYSWKGKIVFI